MFGTRLISGIVLVILSLIFVVSGGSLLLGVTEVISLIGLFELYRALKIQKSPMAAAGYLAALAYFGLLWISDTEYLMMVFIGFLMTCMTIYVVTFPKYKTEEVTGAVFGLLYVPVMLSYLYLTRQMPDGSYVVWLIFISSWGCDTCAYCVGMLIGKHKMAPVLSPKKSVEGGVGGVLGAALLGALYAFAITGVNPTDGHTPVMYAIICAIGALISMVGDLAASAIKRNKEIKDYGTLIPGHGGILDRFDSVLFTAPFIYFLASVLI